jgi:fluoride exporter
MKIIIAIGAGSFLGGVLRYLISEAMHARFSSSFPYGTLTVNIIGCLLIGVALGLMERGNISGEWKMFLAVGLLGGFTTFSTFSLETLNLLRDGQVYPALTYVLLSIAAGLIATTSGFFVIKMV